MPMMTDPAIAGGTGVTPSQEAAIDANTTARHTHANKATLDDVTAAYTSAEKTKLGNMTDSFKGVYADQAAIEAAYPTPVAGWCAWNTATSTIWSVVSGAWANSGIASIGDMLKAVYDPQSIAGDAFSREKHTGAQAIATITGLQTALDGKITSGQTAAAAVAGTFGADGGIKSGEAGFAEKKKLFTGNMPAVGQSVYIAHGANHSKAVGIIGFVNDANNVQRAPNLLGQAGIEWYLRLRGSDSTIWLTTGSSATDLAGRPYRIVLSYEA